MPFFYTLIIVIIGVYLITWQMIWNSKTEKLVYHFFPFLMALIMGELFWALKFWPADFYVNGIFLTIVFYVLINITKHVILQTINKKIIIKYLILSAIVLALVFTTAKWI
ncbi:MAG: hypothetical protein V1898_01415 [Patescibacteria group bacterium]